MSPSNILDDTTSNHLNCFAVLYLYIHNICNKWTQNKMTHFFNIFFPYPYGYRIEKEGFSWVMDNINNWVADGGYRSSKQNGTIK